MAERKLSTSQKIGMGMAAFGQGMTGQPFLSNIVNSQQYEQELAYKQAQQEFENQLNQQKLALLQQEQQTALLKAGLTPSNVPTDRLEMYRQAAAEHGKAFPYVKQGNDFYRFNPQIAEQQLKMSIAPAMALAGGVGADGFGAFIKSMGGKNPVIGVDSPADIYKRGSDLRKEFTDLPLVKDYNMVNRQVKTMDSVLSGALKGDKDSKIAVDQALVMLYNKILDPTSVVRESEFARTPQGQSVINQFIGGVKKIEQGGVGLANADRKALVDSAKVIADEYGNTFNNIYDSYADLAKTQAKVPTDMVLRGFKKHEGFGKKSTSGVSKKYTKTGTNSKGQRVGMLPDGSIEVINGK